MDPQDNTFPIPPADTTGGSIPQPPASAQPMQPAEVSATQPLAPVSQADPNLPPVAPAPATAPVPTQPDWANQAVADAAQLPPSAADVPLTAPSVPSVEPTNPPVNTPAEPLPESISAAAPAPNPEPFASAEQPPITPNEPPVASSIATPVEPLQPGIPQTPAAENTVLSPLAGEQSAVGQPTPIPTENTLDLSGQLPSAQTPLQPGAMQPGVDVSPTGQISTPTDTLAPAAPLATSGGLPTDLGTSYNQEMADIAAVQTTKKRWPLRLVLIIIAILALFLIITLALVFANRNQRKPAIVLNDQTVQSQPTAAPAIALPAGYKLVTRDCYSFGIVPQTTIDFTKIICSIGAKFGASSQYSIAVTPSTASVGDLNSYANTLKAGTAVSQANITIGGLNAIKLVQTVGGVGQQVIAVIPTGKSYTFNNGTVTAFAITTTYNDLDSKTISDNIVKTWLWK